MSKKDEALKLVLEKISKARAKVDSLCTGSERWTMSVPVRPEYDHDMVITDALVAAADAIREALAEQPAQQQEHWNTVFNAVSDAIGKCKSASGMHRSIDAVVNAVQITHDWMGTDTSKPAQQQEPLFWYRPCGDGFYEGPHHNNSIGGKLMREEKPGAWHPLYTSPPASKPWVGLKLADKNAIVRKAELRMEKDQNLSWRVALVEETEAKLREKNNG